MTDQNNDRRHRVAILAYDGLCTFEFGIAAEVFALPRPELGIPWYDSRVCAIQTGPLSALGGISVSAPYGLEALDWADTVVIPGWSGSAVPVPQDLTTRIAAAGRSGKRLISICSGIFVLAASEVLNTRRATTHWRYTDCLKAAYPAISVEQDALYVEDANIFTSAGSAAGLDLCLHIVKLDFGSKIANAVARRLVLPAHRDGGQAQFIPSPVTGGVTSLAPFLDWLLANLSGAHTVKSMAARLGQSERTFIRRFRNATGTSPQRGCGLRTTTAVSTRSSARMTCSISAG